MHRALLASAQVQRIYLDELTHSDQQPIGIRLMQLTIAPEADAIAQARELIERVQQESPASPLKTEMNSIIPPDCPSNLTRWESAKTHISRAIALTLRFRSRRC